ncbi:ATP/GTP-binding protein [Streptomyces brasiliscabiei]|uniref:ATP/GTP-binding protein n=1 Tax=Streptomyces brasiliscabiei TaxID=2736302 RepID=A0ABU8GD44_9ACTN
MVSAPSPTHGAHSATAAEPPQAQPPLPVKLVIAGGFGVGKTTTVGSISEIRPLTTEAAITEVAAGVDDLTHTPDKTTTTVAMDFGCITLDPTLKLYLFGTPGQDRFGFMWDDVVEGALGALVIVDTRRLDDCYAAVDYFEHKRIPFAVAVNAFDGEVAHDLDEVRWALDIADHVPLTTFDARRTGSVRDALLVVLDVALTRAESAAAT